MTNDDPFVLAIIPARGGSKGIPRKNLQMVGGETLVGIAVEQALAAKRIDQVLVSSEDAEIRKVAKAAGALAFDRPEAYHHDNSVQEVDRLLMWTVTEYESRFHPVDIVVLLYPTAPLRRVTTIDLALEQVVGGESDCTLSLCEDSSYLWRVEGSLARPINYDPKTRGPRQKENWNQWVENKAIYVMNRNLLMDTGCRIGGRVGYVEMGKLESIDVDSPEDLELVRALYDRKQGA